MARTVKVKVRDGWAVHDGKQQRGGGETVEVGDRRLLDRLGLGRARQAHPGEAPTAHLLILAGTTVVPKGFAARPPPWAQPTGSL